MEHATSNYPSKTRQLYRINGSCGVLAGELVRFLQAMFDGKHLFPLFSSAVLGILIPLAQSLLAMYRQAFLFVAHSSSLGIDGLVSMGILEPQSQTSSRGAAPTPRWGTLSPRPPSLRFSHAPAEGYERNDKWVQGTSSLPESRGRASGGVRGKAPGTPNASG